MQFTQEHEELRRTVRNFVDKELNPHVREWEDAGRFPIHEVFKKMGDLGLLGVTKPEEFGGMGLDYSYGMVMSEEMGRVHCGGVPLAVGVQTDMATPAIARFGSDELRRNYLAPAIAGDMVASIAVSEPHAGSDVAAVKTTAVKDGDDYVINGTKIWTTYAHYANKMFALVRTNRDGKPQQGITFLLLDMDLPGITIEPIVGLDEVSEQCQVFFDNVRVPQKNRVGAENDGWTVAKYLLTFERGGQEYAPGLNVMLEKIRLMAEKQQTAFGPLTQDPVWQHKFAALEADVLALEFTEMRIKSALSAGKDPGALSSMSKILGTELLQNVTELRIETLGSQSVIWQPQALVPGQEQPVIGPEYALTPMPHYLNSRACSIYGGSNEVQRGIIAKAVLGL